MNRRVTLWRRVLRGGLAAVVAGVLVFLLVGYVCQIFAVSSSSMAPTLRPGDLVLVDRLTYEFGLPHRGDLILFHFRQADDQGFLKRVIGVPGDTVGERNGRFWVNGVPLAWPTADAPTRDTAAALSLPPVQVPAGQFFVLGDNPGASLDSRFWGTVTLHEVVGKALLICWSEGAHWWDVRWHRIGRWLR